MPTHVTVTPFVSLRYAYTFVLVSVSMANPSIHTDVYICIRIEFDLRSLLVGWRWGSRALDSLVRTRTWLANFNATGLRSHPHRRRLPFYSSLLFVSLRAPHRFARPPISMRIFEGGKEGERDMHPAPRTAAFLDFEASRVGGPITPRRIRPGYDIPM
jgi:hypothetical protein